jgi:hypothetical protein
MEPLRVLMRIGGAGVALLVFFVGMKLGCGACDNTQGEDPNDEYRLGCDATGQDRTVSLHTRCTTEAREACADVGFSSKQECARRIADKLRAP